MAAVFEKIKDGKLKEDDVLSANISDLNDKFNIATEDAELTEGNIEETVKEAIDKMIVISDNYSALLLVSKIRNSSLTDFLSSYRLNNSHVGSPPETTAKDIGLFYEKLYKKELVSEAVSNQMLEILKRQSLNDRIPKYLPENIKVAHKTGELEGAKHDAGIVFNVKGDYIIVVLSNGENPLLTAEKIALFSEKIFEYFNK